MEKKVCNHCGVKEGEIHEYGCDSEKCPFCGFQLLSCDCIYEHLNLDLDDEIIDKEGPTNEHIKQWIRILDEKGRVPFIYYPTICVKCGKINPTFFQVDTEEWKRYIEPQMQDKIICKDCFEWIKEQITAAKA